MTCISQNRIRRDGSLTELRLFLEIRSTIRYYDNFVSFCNICIVRVCKDLSVFDTRGQDFRFHIRFFFRKVVTNQKLLELVFRSTRIANKRSEVQNPAPGQFFNVCKDRVLRHTFGSFCVEFILTDFVGV